jgi:hypothetical protein
MVDCCPSSYHSDTNATAFRLLFAVIDQIVLFYLERSTGPADKAQAAIIPQGASGRVLPAFEHPFSSRPNRVMLFGYHSSRFQGATHGMDHTATRRNRSQLRNQLVRQRGTLVFRA